jgi:LCP family protein required for cell wall assembly
MSRRTTEPKTRSRLYRASRRAAIAFTALILSVAALGAAWLDGVRIPFASGTPYFAIQRLHASYVDQRAGAPVFIMLIGSDLRPGVGGARGDALHLVAINPKLHAGTIINIPRDTCVQVPGRGLRRINEANSQGGPALQAKVAGLMAGVPVTYAVEVDFAGFQALVDGVGGVDVLVPFPMHDGYSNANFNPGLVHLNGTLALAFARDRHSFARSDIQRTWNQSYLILAAIQQLHRQDHTFTDRFRLAALLAQHAQLSGMTIGDVVRLASLADAVSSDHIANVNVPLQGSGCLDPAPAASALFRDFADDGVLESYPKGTVNVPDPRP